MCPPTAFLFSPMSIVSGIPVFSSVDKVNVGFGYATFTAPIDTDHVIEEMVMLGMPHADAAVQGVANNLQPAMRRPGTIWTEVSCARAGGHLGYLVEGPDGKLLYCINSAALYFVPEDVHIPTKPWRFCTGEAEGHQLDVEEDLNQRVRAEKAAWDLKYNPQGSSRGGKMVLL